MPGHGEAINDIILPRSQFYNGPYGRMFRNLPPYIPDDDETVSQSETNAREMIEDEAQAPLINRDNPYIPAGYTYFGQFIVHDITYDPTSSLTRLNDPNKLRNFRTPRLDLDSLYGNGPDDSVFLYEKGEFGKLLMGKNKMHEDDLPRNSEGRALIGDPRNDSHIIISQMQLGFIKFHNRMLTCVKEREKGISDRRAFAMAQRLVSWHYQWVIVHDYLKRIVGSKLVNSLLPQPDNPEKFNLRVYEWRDQPFIPVEFSVAAFRFGHSMIRARYALNHTQETPEIALLPVIITPRGEDSDPDSTEHLGGSRPLPAHWTLQWDMFLEMKGSKPQKSRRIDLLLAWPLRQLPKDTAKRENSKPICFFGQNEPHRPMLSCLDLMRGFSMELPSGQRVAKAIGEEPLTGREEPLWRYILKEADELENGRRLGPVGGRIVAEVIIGLLAGDPNSYLNVEPNWEPTLPSEGARFELRDILTFARVPRTQRDIKKIFSGNGLPKSQVS